MNTRSKKQTTHLSAAVAKRRRRFAHEDMKELSDNGPPDGSISSRTVIDAPESSIRRKSQPLDKASVIHVTALCWPRPFSDNWYERTYGPLIQSLSTFITEMQVECACKVSIKSGETVFIVDDPRLPGRTRCEPVYQQALTESGSMLMQVRWHTEPHEGTEKSSHTIGQRKVLRA